MKTKCSLVAFAIIVLLLAAGRSRAATADELVAEGRTFLTQQNLSLAQDRFTSALALDPNHESANALAAATRFLLLPTRPAVSNFLSAAGIARTNRDIFNWTAQFKHDAEGNVIFPAGYNSSSVVAIYRSEVLPALGACRTNLARITNSAFLLSLSAAETSVTDVTVDYGDILLLQSLVQSGEFLGQILGVYNLNVVLPQIQSLGEQGTLSVQKILTDYPSLFAFVSTNELAASKRALSNALTSYFAASDFIRGRMGEVRLFTLDAEDEMAEADFRTSATQVLQSLSEPLLVENASSASNPYYLYAGSQFTGAKSLRSLLPKFDGNRYVPNSLPDYSVAGLFIGLPAQDVEQALRNTFGTPLAGCYYADVFDWGNGGQSAVALLVQSNGTVNVIGRDPGDQAIDLQFKIQPDGSFETNFNGLNLSGDIAKDGALHAEVGVDSGGGYQVDGHKLEDGPKSSSSGLYTGTWSVSLPASGTLRSILLPDGSLYFLIYQAGEIIDLGSASFADDSNTAETDTVGMSTHLQLALNPATKKITGSIAGYDESSEPFTGSLTMSRTAGASPLIIVPPAITRYTTNLTVVGGSNASLAVSATGTQPLSYQWWSLDELANDYPVWQATGSNYTYKTAGPAHEESFLVNVYNSGGFASSEQVTVTIINETNPPIVAFATPANGSRQTNQPVLITGTATDNDRVVLVEVQVNDESPVPASGTTNWSASVMLVPGTNVVRAWAKDASANQSAPKTLTLVRVLTTPLCLQIIGRGTVVGATNGQPLEIGKSIGLTNTPGAGYILTNWLVQVDGTTVLSTNKAVPFVMQSNLCVTATFTDIAKPTLAITAPTMNQRTSNSVFNVTGKVSDNNPSGTVAYQLNGGAWTPATGWSNWTATVYLLPGTNNFRAFAMDAAENRSLTNSVNFVYVLTAPFTLVIEGNGKVTGATNGQRLEIGKSIGLTNAPGPGYILTNWLVQVNGATVLSTNKAVPFVMQSNLVLTATFADIAKPNLTITVPTLNQRTSNSVFNVTGKVTDNNPNGTVAYQLNGGAWTPATGWSNWTATVNLTPGTNNLKTYALDAAGNRSLTNSVSFVYVLTAPLTLVIEGNGKVTGATNGQRLEIGKSIGLTTTPSTGYILTNWLVQVNGTTVLSTNKAVPFVMQSNLVLTATFADIAKPTLTITVPTLNQRTSNSVFNVTGKVTDNNPNGTVAYQLNGGAWTPATGWSNWTATVNLTPGTNNLKAYALDAAGNRSLTNSVNFFYVLTAPLTLVIEGNGKVIGATNGQPLEIGKTIGPTNTPGTGYLLTNWLVQVNGATVLSTNKAVPFVMQSNLVLTATFADIAKPTLTITVPTLNQRTSNSVFNVTGKVTDNNPAGTVSYQLNGGAWTPATGWSNWTATVNLTPGTNNLKAYAVDAAGNRSLTNSVDFVYVLTAPLTLVIEGNGKVIGATNGQRLEIGKSIGLTNTPGTGYVLTNWLVQVNGTTVLSTNKTVPFVMQSDLVLTATFADIAKPTLAITAPTLNQRTSNSVFNVTGKVTDNSTNGTVAYQLNGGAWASATGWSNWTATVNLTPGTNNLMAYAVDAASNRSLTNSVNFFYVLTAGRPTTAAPSAPPLPSLQLLPNAAGRYSLILSGQPGATYLIERSADGLQKSLWNPIWSGALDEAIIEIPIDTSGPAGFYRARQE